ncbi:MAG TPA: DUF2585 family protein [Pyrinomonadaceae bacterium]|nr:DUF2585 family protein [Pyrinomonadaceae bacterium]
MADPLVHSTHRPITSLFIRRHVWPAVVIALILIATAFELHRQGRLWTCTSCPNLLWTSDAWGSQTSQLFLDPYSCTHLLHGVMFAGLLALLMRNLSASWRLVVAIAIECAWEMIENSNTVIQRYREATAALGYQGDTVLNSLGDIFCCVIGFSLALKLGWRWSLVLFFAVEAILLFWIRDSLLLEILMLIRPSSVVKHWQLS